MKAVGGNSERVSGCNTLLGHDEDGCGGYEVKSWERAAYWKRVWNVGLGARERVSPVNQTCHVRTRTQIAKEMQASRPRAMLWLMNAASMMM